MYVFLFSLRKSLEQLLFQEEVKTIALRWDYKISILPFNMWNIQNIFIKQSKTKKLIEAHSFSN